MEHEELGLLISGKQVLKLNLPLILVVVVLTLPIDLVVYIYSEDPIILIIMVVSTVLAGLVVFLPGLQASKLGWLGVRIKDNKMIVRYSPGLLFREEAYDMAKTPCQVKLVSRADPLWPSLRVWGFGRFTSHGLFKAKNGETYYVLMVNCKDVGVYMKVGKLKLFICSHVKEYCKEAERLG